MYLFFFIVGGLAVLFGGIYFFSTYKTLNDIKLFDELCKKLEEQTNRVLPPEMVRDTLTKIMRLSFMVILVGIIMIMGGVVLMR